MIIYVDMDDVLCKYSYKWEIEYTEENPYPQSRVGFFKELEPMPNSIEAINKMSEYATVCILTRPSFKNLHCYSEKAEWVRHYLGEEIQQRTILCYDKSLLKGDILIDDSIRDGQLNFEGELIRFGSPEFENWSTILKYLDNKIRNKKKK